MKKNYYFSVALLIATIPLQIYRPIEGIPVSPDRLFLCVSLTFFFLQLSKDRFFNTSTLMALTALGLCSISSILNFSFSGVLFYSYLFLATLVINDCFDARVGLITIRMGLLIGLLVVFSFGAYQLFYILKFGTFPESVPFSSFSVSLESGHLGTIFDKGGLRYGSDFYRLVLPFSRPQDFSFFIGLFLITYLIIGSLIGQSSKWLNGFLIFIGTAFFILSGSRSTQFALLASVGLTVLLLVFHFLWNQFLSRHSFILAVGFIGVVPMAFLLFLEIDAFGFLSSRLSNGYEAHLMVRMEAVSGLLGFSLPQFLLGIGFQNYAEFIGTGKYPHAHMTPLTMLVELGVVTGITVLVFYFYAMWKALNKISEHASIKGAGFSYFYVRYGFISFMFLANLFYDFGKSLYFFFVISVILGAQRFVELQEFSKRRDY